MAKGKPIYDVFISHTHRDTEFSAEIARVLRSYDLKVFTDIQSVSGERIEDALWEAMAESQALVAVIPEGESSAWIAFELGAAKAWNKPIYAIASNPASARLPTGLQGLTVYSSSRIDEIAQEIKRSWGSLSESERAVLIDEFRRIGVPVDQLALQPWQLSRLTKQFKKRTKRQVASEELMRTLLRLRKTGALRTGDRQKRPKAN